MKNSKRWTILGIVFVASFLIYKLIALSPYSKILSGELGEVIISLLILVPVVIVFSSKKRINSADFIDCVAGIINSEVREERVFLWTRKKEVSGKYKDRLLVAVEDLWREGSTVDLKLAPKSIGGKQDNFMITYPKPTKATILKQGVICFSTDIFSLPKDKAGVIAILDEMVKASETVEQNNPFFFGSLEPAEPGSALQDGGADYNSVKTTEESENSRLVLILVFCVLAAILLTISFGVFFLPEDFKELRAFLHLPLNAVNRF